MKMKHNKRRNTAFIFETLVRELTRASMNNEYDKRKKVVNLIKEFFAKNTILRKELDLYKSLYETQGVKKEQAEKILAEVKRVYSGLNHQRAFDTQSQLVNKVNKDLSTNVFSHFVPNYKAIASISQIFNDKMPIKNKVLLESQIVKHMSYKRVEQKQKEMKLGNAELRIFTKKFNNEYKDLLQEQKELLSKFASSFHDNGLELKIFLNEELGRLKTELRNALKLKEIQKDTNMLTKTEKVLEYLEELKGKFINEDILQRIMKVQQLAEEIKS